VAQILEPVIVRAYIDGFNLYYGGKALAEATVGAGGAPSWKWLDLRALVQSVAAQRSCACVDQQEHRRHRRDNPDDAEPVRVGSGPGRGRDGGLSGDVDGEPEGATPISRSAARPGLSPRQ
jgi:hypothetical protein